MVFIVGLAEKADHPERLGCAAARPSLVAEGKFDIDIYFPALQVVNDVLQSIAFERDAVSGVCTELFGDFELHVGLDA